MDILVDSNVIIDIATEDREWFQWSSETLAYYGDNHVLTINPIIYAEVSIGFTRIEEVEEIMKYDLKKVRKYVRENEIGELIIKTRGFPESVEKFRKKIKLKGNNSVIMFILRKGDDHIIVFSQLKE